MIVHLLKDIVTVYTITEGISSVTGENVKTESTGTNLKARISPLSQSEQYFASKNNLVTTHRMYCEYSTIFNAKDRVAFNTSTYEITGVKNPSEWNKFLQVDLKVVS